MNIVSFFSGKRKKRKQKGYSLIWPLLSTPWVWSIKFPNKGAKSIVLMGSKAGCGCLPPAGSPPRTPALLAWGLAPIGWPSNTLTSAITPSRLSWWSPKLSSKYKYFFMIVCELLKINLMRFVKLTGPIKVYYGPIICKKILRKKRKRP